MNPSQRPRPLNNSLFDHKNQSTPISRPMLCLAHHHLTRQVLIRMTRVNHSWYVSMCMNRGCSLLDHVLTRLLVRNALRSNRKNRRTNLLQRNRYQPPMDYHLYDEHLHLRRRLYYPLSLSHQAAPYRNSLFPRICPINSIYNSTHRDSLILSTISNGKWSARIVHSAKEVLRLLLVGIQQMNLKRETSRINPPLTMPVRESLPTVLTLRIAQISVRRSSEDRCFESA